MNFAKIMLIILTVVSILPAQNKILTLEEAILGNNNILKIEDLDELDWQGESETFCYIDSLKDDFGIITSSVSEGSKNMLLTLQDFNTALKVAGYKPVAKFPKLSWLDKTRFRFSDRKRLFIYNLTSDSIYLKNRMDKDAENIDIHKSSLKAAFVKDDNLFIAYDDKQTVQITFDNSPGISNGNNTVHRNEFGITKGTFWSPRSNFLAYYHLDRSAVTEFPLVDIDVRPAKQRLIRYPMAGMSSEQVKIAVYNLSTGSTTYLQTGEPGDQYLPHVTWSPDEKYIYVVHLNRDQNHLKLIQYNPATGLPLKTLFEEKDPHWIEPEQGPLFIPGTDDKFLWFSNRDGFNQLFVFNTNGKLIRKLTKEDTDIIELIGFDSAGKYIFYTAASSDGMEQHIYRAKLISGKTARLTKESGIHSADFSNSGKYFIDTFSSASKARKIILHKTDGSMKKILLDAQNPLADYSLGEVRFLKMKNINNTELNARMILPPDFDESKQYPVIIYVYGGPHDQMVTNDWISGWRLWFHYIAQQGFIVFSLDNRGTDNRGCEFEQAIYQNLGTAELEDQMSGVDYLKTLSYVDTARIGVHGWSYGGFMTITMMTRNPGIFKVGVAGGPVIDWRYYEIMYGERYMDTPQSNYEGYEKANLLNYVQNLDAKLLVIHGAVDPTVPWQNSLMYLRKAIDLGKQLDFFVYPGDEHNMRGKDRLHLYQKITDYFKLHL